MSKPLELSENEKQTVINSLTYISQGLTIDQQEEFNHVAGIAKKIKESLEPKKEGE